MTAIGQDDWLNWTKKIGPASQFEEAAEQFQLVKEGNKVS